MAVASIPIVRSRRFTLPAFSWQTWAIVVLSLVVAWDNRAVITGPFSWLFPSASVRLGLDYRWALCDSWADAFDAAGSAIADGADVPTADAALKQLALTEREAAFLKNCAPSFDKVAPNEQIPDGTARARLAQLHHDFASGLRRKHTLWWW